MPRSSRHKSSKHSSRDAKEYSDSEKESSLRERKNKDESSARVSKESVSGDKRKLDTKDNKEYYDSLNGEYCEEYTSSRRRKEKTVDGVNDRWNGGDEDRGESSKKSKTSSEKSRRREEVDGEESKKSSSKTDGKHRESSRKEGREIEKEKGRDRERDRDKKYKEGKAEKCNDGEDHHGSKVVSDKPDLNGQDQLRSPGSDDNIKDGKQREGNPRDKCRDDTEEEKHRGDKQKDERSGKEHSRSDDKLVRDEKDASESKRKKSKFQENDHEHGQGHEHEPDSEHDGYRDRSRDYERSRDHGREYDRVRDRDRDRDHNRERDRRERDRHHERDRDRDRNKDHDKDRSHDREKDRNRDYYDRERSNSERDRDFDRDMLHVDDQSVRRKDSRERRRSPDDHDDLCDSKSRINASHTDMETRSSRGQLDGERIKSHSRRPSSSHGAQDAIRHNSDQRPKGISSRDVADLSGGSERGSKYRPSDKNKMEDGSLGELPVERSSSTKASPRGLMEKSPSSTSLERRYSSRSGTRRSLEVEETGLKSAYEDRLSRELPHEKPFGDDSLQADLSFNNKTHQSNSSFPPRPESRGGIGSPKVGSLEEDNRVNISGRYKRGGDMNMGRGQGNAWRGVPNWPSPIPNGFIPFPHGPPHGGFHSMMQPFPSPALFGIRPSMEMSHSGIPYHMPDAERFSGHLRPLGWQNIMDGSGPSHMHGWDMSNGGYRDELHMYGGAEWDHNRRMHSQGWESGVDAWKAQNGDASLDISSISQKDEQSGQAVDDDALAGQTSHSENNRAKSVEAGSNLTSPAKDLINSPGVLVKETSDCPVVETTDNTDHFCRYYLSKVDISIELVDAELRGEYMSLLMDEQSPIVDNETAVYVNLKDEGKTLLKGDYTTLAAFSLFPPANSSVVQSAMDIYKEQRVEMKGLCPTMGNEGSQICHVANPIETEEEERERRASEVEISKAEAAVSGDDAEEETDKCQVEVGLVKGMKSDGEGVEVVVEAKESQGTEEEEEESNGDDVSEKVGPESRESESVISRIHHSPQTTL